MYVAENGEITAILSARDGAWAKGKVGAQVYYDSDNAAYYADLDKESRLNRIAITQAVNNDIAIIDYVQEDKTSKSNLIIAMNGGADSDIRIHGAAGYSTSSGDLAELYFSHDDLEIGDVVVFDQKTNEAVKQSSQPYDHNIVGVVSAEPFALLMSLSDDAFTNDAYHPISLVGKMMVKISLENGPIYPGDPLTSSSTPGHAMKALKSSRIIGYAFEKYDGSMPSTDGVESMFRDKDCGQCEALYRVVDFKPRRSPGDYPLGMMVALVRGGNYYNENTHERAKENEQLHESMKELLKLIGEMDQ